MKVEHLKVPSWQQLPDLLDADKSPLNPHWFRYGSLPLYLLKAVQLLAALFTDGRLFDLRLYGVRIIRLRPAARFSRGMITPALLWAAPLLIKKHDVVQIHTPLPERPIIASWCRLLHRPLLMTHHGDLVMPPGFFNQILQKVGYYVLLATGKTANAVIGHAQTEHLLRECEG